MPWVELLRSGSLLLYLLGILILLLAAIATVRSSWFEIDLGRGARFALVLIGLLSIMLGLVPSITSGRDESTSEQAAEARPPRTEELVAFFGDLRKDLVPSVGSEPRLVLSLSSTDTPGLEAVSVSRSYGRVPLSEEESVDKAWRYTGYKMNEFLVYAYASSDPDDYGIGVCFLKRVPHGYEGFWIGRDIRLNTIILAPYVLSKDDIDEESAKQRFPSLLTPAVASPFEMFSHLWESKN